MLGEIERGGYIERHPDPQDGRARIVRLTERGRALQAAAHQTSRELEADWAPSLGEERFAELRATLRNTIAAGAAHSAR
jgi:DNA-binding MarR family transcriptional regulator